MRVTHPSYALRRRLRGAGLAAALAAGVWAGSPAYADQNGSSTREGLINLPTTGGTVQKEAGNLHLQNNRGAIDFSLPLPPLPGRGGAAPSVTLKYNQLTGGFGSGLGIGWSFDTPSLEMNQDLGTAMRGVNAATGAFWSSLSLDGQRLRYQGPAEGGGMAYVPEKMGSLTKAEYHPSISVRVVGRSGAVETVIVERAFSVQYADGTRHIFGGAADAAEGDFNVAAHVVRWPLTLALTPARADGDGVVYEAVTYSYVKDGGKSYLKSIKAAGGASSYEFDHLRLDDDRGVARSFTGGFAQEDRLLYTRVTGKFDGATRSQWCFAYATYNAATGHQEIRSHPACQAYAQSDLAASVDPASWSVFSQLRAVYRFGSDATLGAATQRDASVHFGYSDWSRKDLVLDGNGTSLAERPLVYSTPAFGGAAGFDPERSELTDFNQDSLVDIVYRHDDKTEVFLGKGDYESSFAAAKSWTLSRPGQPDVRPDFGSPFFHMADIDGDSYTDVLEFDAADQETAHIYLGDGKGGHAYAGATKIKDAAGFTLKASMLKNGSGTFVDMNLDGRSDVLVTETSGQTTSFRFCQNLSRRQASGMLLKFQCRKAAFPGPQPQAGLVLSLPEYRLTDINGDKLPDLVHVLDTGSDKGLCIYENQGSVYDAPLTLFGNASLNDPVCGHGKYERLALDTFSQVTNMWFVDVNGDGINDLATINPTANTVLHAWLGLGDGRFTKSVVDLPLNQPVAVSVNNNQKSRVADLDGDGQGEIILFNGGQGTGAGRVVVIDFNRSGHDQLVKANLLTSIEFESGLRHDFKYSTSTDEFIRDRAQAGDDDEAGVPYIHFPAVVIKQMATSEGRSGQKRDRTQVSEYVYHKPYYDPLDRKFLGFEAVDIVEYGDAAQKSRLTRETYYAALHGEAVHLAGTHRSTEVYEYTPEGTFASQAAQSQSVDPQSALFHSLSRYARTQDPVCAGPSSACRLIERSVDSWETAAVPGVTGAYFTRNLATTSQAFGTPRPQAADACVGVTQNSPWENVTVTATSTFTYDAASNQVTSSTATEAAYTSPQGVAVPAKKTTSTTSYVSIAALGIRHLPASIAVTAQLGNGPEAPISLEEITYVPETGRPATRATTTYPAVAVSELLQGIPAALAASKTYTVTNEYDAFNNTTKASGALGHVETVAYSADGLFPVRMVDPSGLVTTMTYDAAGRLGSYTTPNGLTYTLAYDAMGRRKQIVSTAGTEERYDYRLGVDFEPNLTRVQVRRYADGQAVPAGDTRFVTTISAYSPKGDEIGSFEASENGGLRVLAYAEHNRNGKAIFRWTPFETAAGVTLDEVFASGFKVDALSGLRDATLAGNVLKGTRFVYDGEGRIVEAEQPSGRKVRLSYQPWGQLKVGTPDKAAPARVECQALVQQGETTVGQVDELGHVHKFSRDAAGFITEAKLAGEANARVYRHTSSGQVGLVRTPGVGSTFKFYDAKGRQTHAYVYGMDGALGHTLMTNYDSGSRPLDVYANGSVSRHYEYDAYDATELAELSGQALEALNPAPKGLATKVVRFDPNGLSDQTTLYGYDRLGRVLVKIVKIGAKSFHEVYRYALDGSVTYKRDHFGVESFLRLNRSMRLAGVDVGLPFEYDGATKHTVIEQVRYNPKGQIKRINYRKGVTTDLHYDEQTLFMDGIKSATPTTGLQDLALTLDGNGNVTRIVDKLGEQDWGNVDRSASFGYDARHELVKADFTGLGESFDYAYSPAGTMTRNDELERSAQLTSASYPGANATGLIPGGSPAQAYKFNKFGQLESNGKVLETKYDPFGQMVCARTAAFTVFYGYGSDGARIYKKVVQNTAASGCANPAQFSDDVSLYPLPGLVVEPTGAQSFVFVDAYRVARVDHNVSRQRWFYYLKDHIGSSDVMIDPEGVPVEQMAYRAFGGEWDTAKVSAKWATHQQKHKLLTPAERTHNRFTGQYLDDDTGLYYMGARYYDATLGRFVSPDPLFLEQPEKCTTSVIQCNLYSYVSNNPVNLFDPTGLEEKRYSIIIGVEANEGGAYKGGVHNVTKDTGHTFIAVKVDDQITAVYSFGPAKQIGPTNAKQFANGGLGGRSDWPVTEAFNGYEKEITKSQYDAGMKMLADMKGTPGTYSPDKQCTSNAVKLANDGFKVGSPVGNGPVTAYGKEVGSFSNPYKLNEQLKKDATFKPTTVSRQAVNAVITTGKPQAASGAGVPSAPAAGSDNKKEKK